MTAKHTTDPKDDLDTFDLLGVSGREDSYTDLIVHAFNQDTQFRSLLLKFVDARPGSGWHARQRVKVPVPGSRKGNVPDIVLFDEKKQIIAIEVKVWSSEGFEQLFRYSSMEFKGELVRKLYGDDVVLGESDRESFRLIYLTLDPYPFETAGEFTWKSFDELQSEVLSAGFNERSRLHGLLREFNARIEARSKWEISADVTLAELFEGGPKMLSSRERLERFVRDCIPGESFSFNSGVVNNPQHGQTALVQVFKPEWARRSSTPSGFADSFNAHFELQWLGADGMSFEVHFETEPYLTQAMARLSVEERDRFKAAQSRFIEAFHGQGLAHWRRVRRRGWVSVAVAKHEFSEGYWLPAGSIVEAVSTVVRAAVEEAVPAIDLVIGSPNQLDI